MENNVITVEQTLEELKAEKMKDIIHFMQDKRNSYNQYTEEKAYWTIDDCKMLIHSATTKQQVTIAFRIFERWKFYV